MNTFVINSIGNLNLLNKNRTFSFLELFDYENWNYLHKEDRRTVSIIFSKIVREHGDLLGVEIVTQATNNIDNIYKHSIDKKQNFNLEENIIILREAISNIGNMHYDSEFRIIDLIGLEKWGSLKQVQIDWIYNAFDEIILTELLDVKKEHSEGNIGQYKRVEFK